MGYDDGCRGVAVDAEFRLGAVFVVGEVTFRAVRARFVVID